MNESNLSQMCRLLQNLCVVDFDQHLLTSFSCIDLCCPEDDLQPRRKRKRKATDDLSYSDDETSRGRVRLRRSQMNELSVLDDGDDEIYQQRIR